jgi:hypothetical protein
MEIRCSPPEHTSLLDPTMSPKLKVQACIFDVFGTVVDQEFCLARMLEELAASLHVQAKVDWISFTKEWRAADGRRT